MKRTVLAVWAISGLVAGCGEGDEAASAWLGPTPHLDVDGAIAGRAVDISLEGAAADDLAVLFCERNYVGGVLEKIEIKHVFMFDGMPAELEMELADLDFAGEPASSVAVGAADPAARTTTDINVALQIELEDGTEIVDTAVSGELTLDAFEGTAGPDGIVPSGEGAVGGTFEVTFESASTLVVSFYAPCGENDVE